MKTSSEHSSSRYCSLFGIMFMCRKASKRVISIFKGWHGKMEQCLDGEEGAAEEFPHGGFSVKLY